MTCRYPGGFEFVQGLRSLSLVAEADDVTDDPPRLQVVVTLEEQEVSEELELSTEGSVEQGFTLVGSLWTGPDPSGCPDELLFSFTYALVPPPAWNPAIGESFPPIVVESDLAKSSEVHTLWIDWTVVMTPHMEWM